MKSPDSSRASRGVSTDGPALAFVVAAGVPAIKSVSSTLLLVVLGAAAITIELQGLEKGIDLLWAIARPYAQGIAGLVGEVVVAEVEDDMAGFLLRPLAVENAVF